MFISVVIPTHNRLHLLREAIETIRRQNFTDWELVVFDNASADPIVAHVRGLRDDRVRCVRSEEFLPVTSSWNRAIDLARGEYVVLLGDDDGLTPRYFECLQVIIEKFNKPDLVYNNIYQFWHPGVAPWEPSGYLIDVRHGFFFTGRTEPFLLSAEDARHAASGSINLRINFSFNSQAFVYKRSFLTQLAADGPIYRSPFPDFYIANVALVRSKSTVVVPEPLAIAGVSKASIGFTIYNGQDDRGAALLNTDLENDPVYKQVESHILPGPAYNSNFVVAMEYVVQALPELREHVDFRRYRRVQMFTVLEGQIRGEPVGAVWPAMRGRLSPLERIWAACVREIIRRTHHSGAIHQRLLPWVKQAVSLSGSDPQVRHCGKHDFSRVTDLYEVLESGEPLAKLEGPFMGAKTRDLMSDPQSTPVLKEHSANSVIFYPEVKTSLKSSVVISKRQLSPSLVSRIRKAYQLGMEEFKGYGESGWQGINSLSRDLHDCLMHNGDAELTAMLETPGDTNLFYGFDTLYRGVKLTESTMGYLPLYTFDSFVRLAEAVKAQRIWNPEYGDPFPSGRANPGPENLEKLLHSIDLRIGTKLDFPNPFQDEAGLATERGIACYRSPHAVYQAWRVSQLATAQSAPRVLEIGAGMGRTAYYAKVMGVSNYTIVDLPMTNVAQALFLGQVLGQEAIWLPGDPAESQAGRIKIVPPAWFSVTDEHFNVVLNADSLTEMDRKHAAAYVKKISCEPCLFLSINHENNAFTVNELCAESSLISRHPYWLRKGYVEELYAFR